VHYWLIIQLHLSLIGRQSFVWGIGVAKDRFIRPSYIVINFSPALLTATLLTINNTTINFDLRWCFNAIQKNYISNQLHSMSFIRFCCAHVMYVFTWSLSKIKIGKNIRKKATIVFGILLTCNEFHQAYELIGCIVCIVGSLNLDDAEE
jgi:hypothetical protein